MSSTSLTQFDFNGNSIKGLTVDGETWFVAKDVCDALDIGNVSKACERVTAHNKQVIYLLQERVAGNTNRLLVNSEGLEELVCSSRKPNAIKMAKHLGLKVLTSRKEQESVLVLQSAFADQNPITQFHVHGFQIDLYLAKANIAIECDEHGHSKYSEKEDMGRERMIKQALGCSFIRFDPDERGFNIGDVIYRVRELICY